MTTHLTPYLAFQGNARDAMQFYRAVFGGELAMNTFGEFGQTGSPIEDQIMHAQLDTPGGMILMGSDTPPGMEYSPGHTVTLILHGDDEAAMRGYWEALTEGGTVDVALEKQMWGDIYGQCTDQFGIRWMINISA